MKKIGSVSDFIPDRDRELHRNFMDILRNSAGVALRDMFGMAARRPCSRFWVSERHAAEVVSALIKGKKHDEFEKMFPKRREMYEEITRRVKRLMSENPELCITSAVDQIVNEAAPEFYLTDKSAKIIIYRIRRRGKK